MEKIYIQAKENSNISFKHYNVGMAVYDHALNIWQGFNVKIHRDRSDKPGHDFIAQPKKDNGPIQLKLFTIEDGKPASFYFAISTQDNPNGNDLITGSYTSAKNKVTGKVELIDFKYNTNSGLKLLLEPLFEGSDQNPSWDFLMTITAC